MRPHGAHGLAGFYVLLQSLTLAPEDFLDNVAKEVDYQVRRLSSHPSIALWCGDNELVGALTWFDESRNNRDRYLVAYDRLNRVIEQGVKRAFRKASGGHPARHPEIWITAMLGMPMALAICIIGPCGTRTRALTITAASNRAFAPSSVFSPTHHCR